MKSSNIKLLVTIVCNLQFELVSELCTQSQLVSEGKEHFRMSLNPDSCFLHCAFKIMHFKPFEKILSVSNTFPRVCQAEEGAGCLQRRRAGASERGAALRDSLPEISTSELKT